MGNCGYTQETAEKAIKDKHADLIAFGRPFISNPDLVERFTNDCPLAPEAPTEVWYAASEKGYADYPVYSADD
jgi:N-ethylmaleimide reductase